MRSFRLRRSCVTPVLYLPSRRDISASNIVRFFAQVPPSNSEMLQQWSQWSLFLLVSILVLAVSPLLDTNIDFRYQASSHGARKFIPSVTLAYRHYDVCNPLTVQTIWLIWLFCTTGLWSHWPPRLISRSPDSNNHAPKRRNMIASLKDLIEVVFVKEGSSLPSPASGCFHLMERLNIDARRFNWDCGLF